MAILFRVLALIYVEHICGNITDFNLRDIELDSIAIEWFDTYKKIARFTSSKGEVIALKLATNARALNNGDILSLHNKSAIIISIIPSAALCVSLQEYMSIALFCYEVGNLHAPLFYIPSQGEFCTPFEPPVQRMLERLKIHFAIKDCILEPKDRVQIANPILKEPELIKSPDFQIHLRQKV